MICRQSSLPMLPPAPVTGHPHHPIPQDKPKVLGFQFDSFPFQQILDLHMLELAELLPP
jgi:hypothetical protein